MQRTGILLVAHERNHDPRAVERTNAFQCFERVKDDDVPAFHVRAARTGSERVQPNESLALALEDSVQVSDQQESFAAASLPFGEQVTGATDSIRQRDPLCLETK